MFQGEIYNLLQFHIHSPSENTVSKEAVSLSLWGTAGSLPTGRPELDTADGTKTIPSPGEYDQRAIITSSAVQAVRSFPV